MKLRGLLEAEYGVYDLLNQHMDQIKLDSGPRTFRMLQTQLALGKDAYVKNFLKINGYLEDKAMAQVYWGFATGGNSVSHKLQHLFNKRVNLLCDKHDVPTRHYHIDKKDVITERQKF